MSYQYRKLNLPNRILETKKIPINLNKKESKVKRRHEEGGKKTDRDG